MKNFTNSILIVVFNYSNCICNKNVIKDLYKDYFKQIIFYSDLPEKLDEEINFIDINAG